MLGNSPDHDSPDLWINLIDLYIIDKVKTII